MGGFLFGRSFKMAELQPQYLDTLSYTAKEDRQFFRDILTEGVLTAGALAVSQHSTPDMSVDIAAGISYVQNDEASDRGHYRCSNDALVTKAIAASDPSNGRIDRAILQVRDSTDISGAVDNFTLEILTGTPAGSPVAPTLPNNAISLATVAVGASVVTITNANITDQRSRIGLQNVSEKGWDSAVGPWTYNAANKINTPAGALLIYHKGDKFKLTANSVVLQGYIIGVADTVLTVVGNTLTNHVFTLPYYSHIENPLGFPQYFAYTPTGPTNTTLTGRFCINGRKVKCHIHGVLTSSTDFAAVTLPVAASANIIATVFHSPAGIGGYTDTGTVTVMGATFVFVSASATEASIRNVSGAAYTNVIPITWANTDLWFVNFDYEM